MSDIFVSIASMVAGLCHLVFSRRKNSTRKDDKTKRRHAKRRKDEKTPGEKTKRRNNAVRKDELAMRKDELAMRKDEISARKDEKRHAQSSHHKQVLLNFQYK